MTVDCQFSFPEPLIGLPNKPNEFCFQPLLIDFIDSSPDLFPLGRQLGVDFENFKSSLRHKHSVIIFGTLPELLVLQTLHLIALDDFECSSHDIDFVHLVCNLVHLSFLDPYVPVHLHASDALSHQSLVAVLLCKGLKPTLIHAEVHNQPQTKECHLLVALLVNMDCRFFLDGLKL